MYLGDQKPANELVCSFLFWRMNMTFKSTVIYRLQEFELVMVWSTHLTQQRYTGYP